MGANPNDVKKAEYYVEQFEKRVSRARGKDIGKTYEAKAAMKRVKTLAKAHPDDPAVKALVERVRNALRGSKGNTFQITPEMLAYRESENRAIEIVGAEGAEAFEARLTELKSDDRLIAEAFPIADPWDDGEIEGRHVILDGVRYPDNLFQDTGQQFLYVGQPSTGFYFLDLGDRAFRSAYKAIQRYAKTISPDIAGEWQIVGKIEKSMMAIPDASPQPTRNLETGWRVDVEMIHIPGRCAAIADDSGKGNIAGEEAARSAIESGFTVTELADDAPPEEVVRVCAMAVKEKNIELLRKTMHDAWFVTPIAEARFYYRYDRNLERFAKFYVHVEPEPDPVIRVLRGEKIDDDEDFFLTDEDKTDIIAHADPLVEEAEVRVRRYNERGKQEGTPAPVWLRSEDGGPWRIWEGFPV